MRTVGIKLADGSFYPIMEEGSAQKKTLELTTAHNNQTCVMVDLYRSKTCSMEDAEYIDTLKIENLVEHPNGEPSISFDVGLDENGELSASIADPETGATSNSEITLVSRTVEERLQADDYSIEESESGNGNGAAVAAGVAAGAVAGAGLMAAAAALSADKKEDEAPVAEDDVTVVEEPVDEGLASFDETSVEDEGLAGFDEAPATDEGLASFDEAPAADEGLASFDETPAADDDLPSFDETPATDDDLPNFDETVIADEGLASFDETPPADEGLASFDEAPATDDDLPSFDEAPAAGDDTTQTEDFSVPDGLTDNPDITEASGFADTGAKDPLFNDETIAEDSNFDIPDVPDVPEETEFDSNSDFDTSSDLDSDFDTASDFDSTPDPVPMASEGLNFQGLYDKETEMGNSSENQDEDIKKKTRAPVIICVVCAIICLIATALVLLVLPTKFNLRMKHSQKKQETTVEKPAEKTAETVQETKPEPVPQAKEDEVVVIEKAEEVKPVPPPAAETKPAGVTYKIKWGDTLWDIADTYYKNPWRYKKIAKYNNIKNPDYIISGTVITIPAE